MIINAEVVFGYYDPNINKRLISKGTNNFAKFKIITPNKVKKRVLWAIDVSLWCN